MYKRTKQALINSTPPLCTCMFEAQFGEAKYSDVAFTITTRIDSAGCFGVIEYQVMNNQTICINSKVDGKQPSLQDRVYSTDGCATAITTSFHPSIAEPKIIERDTPMKEPQINIVGYMNDGKHQQDFIQHEDGISRAICCGTHGSEPHLTKTMVAEPNVLTPKRTDFGKQGYIEVQDGGEVSPTLTTSGDNINRYEGMQVEQIDDKVVETTYRIRKLTPRECFRLMGVDDKDIDKIQNASISNTQQYKLAGNSIVIDCLYHIFRKMFTETQSEDRQLTLF